jgi:hypothetical protein
MADQATTYTVTSRLAPGSETAALYRVMSVFHSRQAVVHRLTFDSASIHGPTVTARVSLTNAPWTTLQQSLHRLVEVAQVMGAIDTRGAKPDEESHRQATP